MFELVWKLAPLSIEKEYGAVPPEGLMVMLPVAPPKQATSIFELVKLKTAAGCVTDTEAVAGGQLLASLTTTE